MPSFVRLLVVVGSLVAAAPAPDADPVALITKHTGKIDRSFPGRHREGPGE